MSVSFFIARRFFLSKRKKTFINIISIISMIVVAVGTASLILILSVFNGLEGLFRELYGNFDPDIIITPVKGKSFLRDAIPIERIKEVASVSGVSEVLEDNVLIKYADAQRVVKMKGVDTVFSRCSGIVKAVKKGSFPVVRDGVAYALIGMGVQYELGVNTEDDYNFLQIYYPKNVAHSQINPTKMYEVMGIKVGGVFAVEKYYDENYIFVPLQFSQKILNKAGKRSALEIYTSPQENIDEVRKKIQGIVGSAFEIKTNEELRSDIFKVLKIEKFITVLVLSLIIGIASINIFFALSMLVLDKQKDVSTLVAMGMTKQRIKRIFFVEGLIIGTTGGFLGLLVGTGIAYLQQEFGLIGFGIESAVVSSYPIELRLTDVLLTSCIFFAITALSAIYPAMKSASTFSLKHLY